MRTITAPMQAALAGGTTDVSVMFLKIAFSDGDLTVWTGGQGPVTWNSETWTGLGQVLQLEPAAESSDGSPQRLTISLSPLIVTTAGEEDENLITRLAAINTRGAVVDLWLGFVTVAGAVVADPLHIFSGRIDQRLVEDSGEQIELRFFAVSELEDGDRETRFRLSPARLAARGYPTDKFFDHIHEVEDIEIKWPGKGYWEKRSN